MSILHVAKLAGVSVATVSRVINRVPNVSVETAKQVRAAMKELAYVPAEIRPGPKPGSRRTPRARTRTATVAVLTVGQPARDWLTLPLMAAAFAEITTASKERHLRLLIDEMQDPEQVSALIQRREIDGAIVFRSSRLGRRGFDALLGHPVPLVWLFGAIERPVPIDHVTTDNIAVGHVAQEYLGSCGCSEVAFVTDVPEWPLMRIRGQSFANAARDSGRRSTSFVVGSDPTTVESYGPRVQSAGTLEELVEKLATSSPRPTGIFSARDRLTLQLYPLLQRRGLIPGKDVTVVSCDNQESLLSMLSPRPASVDLRPEAMGRLALSRLMHRMEHPEDVPIQIQVLPDLGRCGDPGYPGKDGDGKAGRVTSEASEGRQNVQHPTSNIQLSS
jgi:DNA-binding LacI/PurR family transcriptional regulator